MRQPQGAFRGRLCRGSSMPGSAWTGRPRPGGTQGLPRLCTEVSPVTAVKNGCGLRANAPDGRAAGPRTGAPKGTGRPGEQVATAVQAASVYARSATATFAHGPARSVPGSFASARILSGSGSAGDLARSKRIDGRGCRDDGIPARHETISIVILLRWLKSGGGGSDSVRRRSGPRDSTQRLRKNPRENPGERFRCGAAAPARGRVVLRVR